MTKDKGEKMCLRNIKLIGFALMSIASTAFCGDADSARLSLVPFPREAALGKGSFTPKKAVVFEFSAGQAEIAQIATTFARDLSTIGFSASQGKASPGKTSSIVELSIGQDEQLGKEGYRLTIDSKAAIAAATEEGLFWGTRTLLQLLQSGPGRALPRLTIIDKPRFEYRGLMIDNARRFHSLDFHIQTIKRMSSFKLNRYQIHFSDDQSYTLPSDVFAELPTQGRHYSREQIRQLVAAGREYHVTIVPEIDVPGHSRALIEGIPSLKCADIAAGRRTNKLCVGKEETYETLEKLFSEVMEMFPGQYWHLGSDEVRYGAPSCDACRERMKDEKLADGDQLFHYFINRMHRFCKSKGRKMLVWEGFHPDRAPTVDKDVIVCPFDVKHKGLMPSDYFKAGYKTLNTAWSPLYVADRLCMTTPEILARWSPYMFGAGRSPQPLAYWKKFQPGSLKPGQIIGAQMCSWANEEKVEEGLLFGTGPGFFDYGRPGPRVQIMAERLWTGSKTNPKDLLERVGQAYW